MDDTPDRVLNEFESFAKRWFSGASSLDPDLQLAAA
jgi:hypothetical protein